MGRGGPEASPDVNPSPPDSDIPRPSAPPGSHGGSSLRLRGTNRLDQLVHHRLAARVAQAAQPAEDFNGWQGRLLFEDALHVPKVDSDIVLSVGGVDMVEPAIIMFLNNTRLYRWVQEQPNLLCFIDLGQSQFPGIDSSISWAAKPLHCNLVLSCFFDKVSGAVSPSLATSLVASLPCCLFEARFGCGQRLL